MAMTLRAGHGWTLGLPVDAASVRYMHVDLPSLTMTYQCRMELTH